MFFGLIQMQVITSEVELRSPYDMCKAFNNSFFKMDRAKHTRIVNKSQINCNYAGVRDQYDMQRAVNITNYYRNMVGLSDITYSKSKEINKQMEEAIIMMYMNNKYKNTGWNPNHKCFTESGKAGAEASSTDMGNYEIIYSDTISTYIEYGAPWMEQVPRRSLLDPELSEIAGEALFNVIAVRYKNYQAPPVKGYKNPNMIAFPPPGYFPVDCNYGFCNPPTNWYLQLRDYEVLPNDSIATVECDGWNSLEEFKIYPPREGFKGSFALKVKKPYINDECVVSIKSAQEDKEWRYTVIPFDCNRRLPKPQRTAFPDVDGQGDAAVSGIVTDSNYPITPGGVAGLFFGIVIACAIAGFVGFFLGKRQVHNDDVLQVALV